ncbi:MAG TPA: cysteine synthase A [Gammaproteobacteria bacterium]|nr:cysteine synthase A [Gammaproteobacteria bacterium]
MSGTGGSRVRPPTGRRLRRVKTGNVTGLSRIPRPRTVEQTRKPDIRPNFAATVGGTPLIRLRRPSEATRCNILAKAEFLNPGGSVKDRAALGIIRDAEARGLIRPGGLIVEGTAGNTGIGLALLGASRGYRTLIVMPETQSSEKVDMLRLCGAEVRLVPAVPYRNPDNYVHVSERLAAELAEKEPGGAFWANQFDNVANRDIHAETTGEEIWEQTGGAIDAFVCAAGTGGTIAGVGAALKRHNPAIKIALADPEGSALYNYVTHGELKAEGSSVTEGIGNSRITRNFDSAPIDLAFSLPDRESLPVLYDLLRYEGLCVGGSSGVNVAGAIRMARELGPGHTVVTILCDSAQRYQRKLFNREFLASKNLPVPTWLAGD